MELREAVELIKPALQPAQGARAWAELGSGKGLFTQALAILLEPGSTINAVDKSPQAIGPALNKNRIVFHQLDFNGDTLPFAELDGILMANSIHFIQDKRPLLSQLKKLLRQNGQLVIIEYEMDKGNAWVPHPVPYASLKEQLSETGFTKINLVSERQSVYGARKMYVCAAVNGKK